MNIGRLMHDPETCALCGPEYHGMQQEARSYATSKRDRMTNPTRRRRRTITSAYR
jgi:hypothetical protein